MTRGPLLVGCGAGFAGDRFDAALPVAQTLVARSGPACLIFETLAERTLALAQVRRRADPEAGHAQTLDELLRPVLALCHAHRIPIVGNFGAANPLGAARRVQRLGQALGLRGLKVAALLGDDLLQHMDRDALLALQRHPAAAFAPEALVSANVYLGAEGIAQALAQGADVVVTGRVADPALALGPLVHHFGWAADDWDRLAGGTLAGHLLECGAQITGGYFADPGFKDVPGLATVGYPVAEIDADGGIVVGKADGTGGRVDERTVKEQILYEIHDPAAYLTPDVVLDLREVEVQATGPDRVSVRGARGHARPATLKGTVCFDGGWMGEGEISYAGPNARARGLLAIEVLRERLAMHVPGVRSHFDLVGLASVFNDARGDTLAGLPPGEPPEVRVRMAVGDGGRDRVARALSEVEALYTTGPAAGGGVRTSVTPLMNSTSVYVPRESCRPTVRMLEEAADA